MLHSLSDDRLRVLDLVCLIEHNVEELLRLEHRHATFDSLVVDDQDIVLVDLLENLVALELRSLNHTNFYIREELLDLVCPVPGQGSRTDDQVEWPVYHLAMLFDLCLLEFLALIKHNYQALESLAQAHVVTEGAIQVVLAQLGHPVDAFLLVVSEGDVLLHRHDDLVLTDNSVLCENFEEVESLLRLLIQLGGLLVSFEHREV